MSREERARAREMLDKELRGMGLLLVRSDREQAATNAIVRAIEEEREALRPLLDAIDRWEQDNAPETEQAIMDAAAAIRQRSTPCAS